jgi:hypothetical protein
VNHRRLVTKFNCRNNSINLARIEISIELFSRLPFFDEKQVLAFIKVSLETRIDAAGQYSRWTEEGAKCAQDSCPLRIWCHDFH